MPREFTTRFGLLGAGVLAGSMCASLGAQISSDLVVDGGSTATITLTITVTTSASSEVQARSVTVGVSGGGSSLFQPDYEPFTSVELSTLQFNLENGGLNYELFCSTLLGCIDVNVNLSNITASLVQPSGASFDGSGHANFNATWNLRADYDIQSSLFSNQGQLDTTADVGFEATFVASGGDVFVHQLGLGSISSEVPAEEWIQINLLTEVNLDNASLSGSYEPPPPASCGSGGPCGGVHADAGCDDVGCCATVCESDFYCCEFHWDASCVNLAVQLCGVIPENDSCANARPLELGRFPFTTQNCSTDGPQLITECGTDESGLFFVNDVWFTHTAPADNGIVVSTCAHADFDTRIAVYDGCNGDLIACDDNSSVCPGGTTQVGFHGVQGETYLIRVGGVFGSGSGEIDIAWAQVDDPYSDVAVEWSASGGGNGHFYTLYALGVETTYASVLEAASHFGGYPATITSPEEQDFINRNMPATQLGGPTAIGLYQDGDDEPAGGWQWVTGEPLAWTNWAPGEPNEVVGAIEDWGVMYPDGTWNDNPDYFAYVLIEFDTDPMIDEVTWEESDGGNGHSYRGVIMDERITWSEALAYAENRGGTLVSLEESEESEWVFRNIGAFAPLWSMTDYNGGPWIGLFKREGQWIWMSEEPFDGSNWFTGEPNGSGDRGCLYARADFTRAYGEGFGGDPSGALFGLAQYADVFGNNRLKVVSDSFPGTWGTWASPSFDGAMTGFTASFRFSFKNENGGPGDGFSFIWGDLSDTSNDRISGGEFGIFAFQQDGAGLSVGINSYPGSGDTGIDGRWGTDRFVHAPMDFQGVTYSDYKTAGRPESMPTVTVQWNRDSGVTVWIAFPSSDPQLVYANAGIGELAGINPSDWSFGFAARNGSIDQDVLIGDFAVTYDFLPGIGGLGGGPRNTIDDTPEENVRRTLIIEFPPEADACVGDLDDDGVVGGADLTLLLGAWGTCADPEDCVGDLDGDGVIGGADLTVLLGSWGACSG